MAVPCGGQGRKRAALGETSGPGKSGIHPDSLFAAAVRWLMGLLQRPMRASAPTNAGQRVAKRNARKEELVKCVLAPRRSPHHLPRDGSIDLAEGDSVPEGQAKPEQAPIRRPPYSNFARTCKVATKRVLFFWTVHSPFSFRPRPKRKWGVHCPAGNPAESPGRQIAAPTVPPRAIPPGR